MSEQWNLVVTTGAQSGPRGWLRPKWYVVKGHELSAGSPWPFEMEWRPVPDPARFCVRCGADKTEGTIWTDPEGVIKGPHCIPCRDELRPEDDAPPPWSPPSPLRRVLLRLSFWRLPRWTDRAYWAWCGRFGERIVQQEPVRPD